LDDLSALGGLIGESRLVGLGASTYGTREFNQFNHRLFEYLVRERGFTSVILEAGLAECARINDYVTLGRGDAQEAIHGTHFWTWDTEEVLALVEWMRAHNEAHGPVLKIYGCDIQFTSLALRNLVSYLARVDAEVATYVSEVLAPLAVELNSTEELSETWRSYRADDVMQMLRAASRLQAHLESQAAKLILKLGPEPWDLAYRYARVLRLNLDMFILDSDGLKISFNARNRAMVENIEWVLRKEGDDARAVLWTHSAHVSRTHFTRDYAPLGMALARRFDADYVALGYVFGGGGFQARPLRVHGQGSEWQIEPMVVPVLQEFTIAPADAGSLSHALREVGLPLFILDLRSAKRGEEGGFFHTEQTYLQIGGPYLNSDPQDALTAIVPADHYDALVYFEQTSHARPLPRTVARFKLRGPGG
jgi:erythromycin esterase